jgi:carboxypeptidase Q
MRGGRAGLRVCICCLLLVILSSCFMTAASLRQSASPTPPATAQPAGKHSSAEDRARLVAVARKLEAAPLDPALAPDRAWAVQWVVAAPDVHARICGALSADLRRPRYKYRTQMTDQLLISSAAFLIEHPEQGATLANQNVAGMEGVLKAYQAILKSDPQATAKSLDDLLQKQKEGKLDETVREIVKGCG